MGERQAIRYHSLYSNHIWLLTNNLGKVEREERLGFMKQFIDAETGEFLLKSINAEAKDIKNVLYY